MRLERDIGRRTGPRVLYDPTVPKYHAPVSTGRHASVVRDRDYRVSAPCELIKQRQDLITLLGVERPGWFVGQDHASTVHQGPGDRDALLFPAG